MLLPRELPVSSHIKDFFPLVDVLIMTVLTGEALADWEDWVPQDYGWVCAVIAAPTKKYKAAAKIKTCPSFTGISGFWSSSECPNDADSMVFLCDNNCVARLFDFFA